MGVVIEKDYSQTISTHCGFTEVQRRIHKNKIETFRKTNETSKAHNYRILEKLGIGAKIYRICSKDENYSQVETCAGKTLKSVKR